MRLKDRVAIVTGGGVGLGRAYCLALARAGAKVVVADVQESPAKQVAREIGGIAVRVDVASAGDTRAMAQTALEAYGRIDILVNNAALYAVLEKRPFFEIPEEEWDRVMAVNVKGVFLCVKAVHPAMKKQRKGKIINISSGTVLGGVPNFLHYVTSKAGVIGLTRALAREVGPDNICVNAITPGLTLASAEQRAMFSAEYLESRRRARALQRDQVPEDLVGTVLFLASDESDFLTGQTINVDGGTWFI